MSCYSGIGRETAATLVRRNAHGDPLILIMHPHTTKRMYTHTPVCQGIGKEVWSGLQWFWPAGTLKGAKNCGRSSTKRG